MTKPVVKVNELLSCNEANKNARANMEIPNKSNKKNILPKSFSTQRSKIINNIINNNNNDNIKEFYKLL